MKLWNLHLISCFVWGKEIRIWLLMSVGERLADKICITSCAISSRRRLAANPCHGRLGILRRTSKGSAWVHDFVQCSLIWGYEKNIWGD